MSNGGRMILMALNDMKSSLNEDLLFKEGKTYIAYHQSSISGHRWYVMVSERDNKTYIKENGRFHRNMVEIE